MNQENIRNFCIIAHIDHGKSTLADRFLELTGTVEKRKMRQQYLDTMDLERERGITIKLQPVKMSYKFLNHKTSNFELFTLNLIDTPGHVDFSYEVSRSLAAVEGAILLVDATKGVQAQTLANLHLAQEQKLTIIPAINKIDLPGSRVKETEDEIRNLGLDGEIYKISAKEGVGVDELLRAVVEKVPPPRGKLKKPFRALIFDSNYDLYKGVLVHVRAVDGEIKRGQKIHFLASGARAEVLETGVFLPNLSASEKLSAGEVGYIATGLKDVSLCRVGDTIVDFSVFQSDASLVPPLVGYEEPKPMIFASFYPAEGNDFDLLKDSLSKLKLSDASLVYEPESSEALGRGYRCGFLGMLHMEIVTERLKREYNLQLIVTTPSVVYQLTESDGKEKTIFSPQELPDQSKVKEIKEPWIKLEVLAPGEYLGALMNLLQGLGGIYLDTKYLTGERVVISYEAPLREIIVDFYDRLKSATSGYASMSYELIGWREGDLVPLDILVAGEKIEAFSRIIPRQKAPGEGKALVEKLKEVLPSQLFAVSLQAAVGGKILAREDISARRKDVTGYLYGGDYSRKRKLLEKQKRGKKRMEKTGRVDIPQEVFLKVLKK